MAEDAHRPGSGHPVPAAVARSEAEITGVVDQPTWSMRPEEVRESATRLLRKRARDEDLLARVIAEGERNGAFTETGATGAAAWLAHTTPDHPRWWGIPLGPTGRAPRPRPTAPAGVPGWDA